MRVILFVSSRISNFKVLNCQSGHIIHWNLEIHGNGANLFSTLSCSGLLEGDFGDHHVFVTSLKLLNGPLSHLLLSFVLETLPLNALR